MNNKEALTKKQEIVYNYIKDYIKQHHYPPSIRDICKGVDLSSTATVHVHLSHLIEKGYIKKSDFKNRTLELVIDDNYNVDENVVKVPLVGKVTAGLPIEAIERPNEFMSLPAYLIPLKKEVFTLEVSGDSMINAGIFDGDIAIIERCNTAKNGEIVVAMNDENEVTLKTFYKEDGYYRLQPENDFLTPIILKDVTILGKIIGLYRKF
ncbi:MAG: transcriptional repressor LexA [bacterium]|nr:transcriptional repressor LexA [bacterium]